MFIVLSSIISLLEKSPSKYRKELGFDSFRLSEGASNDDSLFLQSWTPTQMIIYKPFLNICYLLDINFESSFLSTDFNSYADLFWYLYNF